MMGIDLTLLVVDGNLSPTSAFARTAIEFGRNYDAFAAIKGIAKPHERRDLILTSYRSRVPDGSMKGESCYGIVRETPYGEPLTYVYASDFCKAMRTVDQWDQQRAAVAYLDELPVETLIALYWH